MTLFTPLVDKNLFVTLMKVELIEIFDSGSKACGRESR